MNEYLTPLINILYVNFTNLNRVPNTVHIKNRIIYLFNKLIILIIGSQHSLGISTFQINKIKFPTNGGRLLYNDIWSNELSTQAERKHSK